jgi:hypothetical protein
MLRINVSVRRSPVDGGADRGLSAPAFSSAAGFVLGLSTLNSFG